MQKFKVNGQLAPKIECKETDRQTDRQTHGGKCITFLANAVGKYIEHYMTLSCVVVSTILTGSQNGSRRWHITAS